MKRAYLLLLIIAFLMSGSVCLAQDKSLWTKENEYQDSSEQLIRASEVLNYGLLSLDTGLLKNKLLYTSKKFGTKSTPTIIEFPDADGQLYAFTVWETALMHPKLSAKYPGIKSYAGQGVDDAAMTVYFTINSLGLYAVIFSAEKGTTYIDPYSKDRTKYMVYLRKDAKKDKDFACLVQQESQKRKAASSQKNAIDLKLRTFRLALAATEEYSNFHVDQAGVGAGSSRADSINAVLSAMVVTMSRVNPLFERDVALTMQLIPNTDELIFLETDPGNDPYNNNSGTAMLGQNQTTTDNIIGTANYDIGHVFSTGGGGVATLNSPCNASIKARGVTGSSSPVGDPFNVDLVAHEMGHQYGANHTFNGTSGNCTSTNRNEDTAVEPGSGSTIMAYAGICAPQNIQSNSDAYFHSISIQEIFDNITRGTGQCAVVTNFVSNLNVPNVDAGDDYVVPISTPLKLMGEATDLDGNLLTYTWEQTDNEVIGINIPPSENQTVGAIFRSLTPSTSPDRYLPALATVISGSTSSTWEVIPAVARTVNFDLTVRDNVPGEGQSVSDDLTITVTDNAGPFIVTSQSTPGISWTAGNTESITWDVAGTTGNGVDAATVDILLSLDGGITFTEVLAANTANDGTENITVPNVTASNIRIMVAAVDHIFYAVNSEPVSIGSFETICTTYDPSGLPVQIPDNSSTGVSSVINITEDYPVTDLNLSLDISHSWLWDLQVYLKAPNGTEVLIYDRSCGSSGVQRENIDADFDDENPTVICESTIPAIIGDTKPDNSLSLFNGQSSLGSWTLRVVDNAPNDIGTLNDWSLELCRDEPTASVDDFSFKEFSVYPNPFDSKLTIVLDADFTDDVILILYDLQGRMVVRKKYFSPNPIFKEELSLNDLASGIYILSARKGNAKASKKIVKY